MEGAIQGLRLKCSGGLQVQQLLEIIFSLRSKSWISLNVEGPYPPLCSMECMCELKEHDDLFAAQ